ncbi:MAG: class I SAM-dependent methyltransferase [candidate division Zixibacteria bacterium]|nr:class I SAM-dependent methyltransferase [candidate division Zixibacteria bacterium]
MTDFSKIAPYYDLMTGFKKRLINDFGNFKNLVNKFSIKKALDAGCGSGVHSIILSKIGVDVTGLDASAEMLELTRKNMLREGVEIPLEQEYFETMPNKWTDSFDAVFCMANSLVGVETGERLSLAMKSFQRVLKPGGKAIIQLVNFMKYRQNDERIIKISNEENITFVRFFDFEEKVVRLNVIIIEHDMGNVKHQFISEKILPVSSEVIKLASDAGGFSNVEFFSNLTLADTFLPDSPNLIVVLTK